MVYCNVVGRRGPMFPWRINEASAAPQEMHRVPSACNATTCRYQEARDASGTPCPNATSSAWTYSLAHTYTCVAQAEVAQLEAKLRYARCPMQPAMPGPLACTHPHTRDTGRGGPAGGEAARQPGGGQTRHRVPHRRGGRRGRGAGRRGGGQGARGGGGRGAGGCPPAGAQGARWSRCV